MVRAMGVLGINEKDQESLWKVLAAILLLGIFHSFKYLFYYTNFKQEMFLSSRKRIPPVVNPLSTLRTPMVLTSLSLIHSSISSFHFEVFVIFIFSYLVVQSVAKVLNVDHYALTRSLTSRTITSGTQKRMSTITVPLDTAQVYILLFSLLFSFKLIFVYRPSIQEMLWQRLCTRECSTGSLLKLMLTSRLLRSPRTFTLLDCLISMDSKSSIRTPSSS